MPSAVKPTLWKFDSADKFTDWVLANQSGDPIDHSAIMDDPQALGAKSMRIYTQGGTMQRKKRRTALQYGAGRYIWRTFIPKLDTNDKCSIGSWLYNDDEHELDFEVCHGKQADRIAHGAHDNEVLAWMTSQSGPYFSVAVPITRDAYHTFEIDMRIENGVYHAYWFTNGVQRAHQLLTWGQAFQFHIFCSVENLNFTGDHVPLRDNAGRFNYVQYIPHADALAPKLPG